MSEVFSLQESTVDNDVLLDELLEFIDEQEVNELGISVEDTFTIKSRAQADYLTGEYVKLQNEVKDIEDTCKNAITKYQEKIERWREAELRKREGSMEWLSARLRAYAAQELADSKRKSLSLPNGSLKFTKKSQMHYDDEVLYAFLENKHPEYLKEQPKKIDKVGLKKVCVERNGRFYVGNDEVDGMTVELQPDSFKIS